MGKQVNTFTCVSSSHSIDYWFDIIIFVVFPLSPCLVCMLYVITFRASLVSSVDLDSQLIFGFLLFSSWLVLILNCVFSLYLGLKKKG